MAQTSLNNQLHWHSFMYKHKSNLLINNLDWLINWLMLWFTASVVCLLQEVNSSYHFHWAGLINCGYISLNSALIHPLKHAYAHLLNPHHEPITMMTHNKEAVTEIWMYVSLQPLFHKHNKLNICHMITLSFHSCADWGSEAWCDLRFVVWSLTESFWFS